MDKSGVYFSVSQKILYIALIVVGLLGSATRGGILHALVGSFFIISHSLLSVFVALKINKKSFITYSILSFLVLVGFYFLSASSLLDLDVIKYVDVDSGEPDSSVSHRFWRLKGRSVFCLKKFFCSAQIGTIHSDLPVIEASGLIGR